MKKSLIDSVVKKTLIWGIILSVGFVCGVPAIIFGALNGHVWLLVLGIIACVAGFYGAPIVWTSFGEKKKTKRIVDCVLEENLLSVNEISSQLQLSEKFVKENLQKAIMNKYLSGYIFDGKTLVLNEKKPANGTVQNKCSSCGGPLTKTSSGYICSYCGARFE